MKTIKIIAIVATFFGLSQCGSLKLEKNPPFKIANATYNHWVGGQPGVSGTKVEIYVSDLSSVVFDSLFFLDKKSKVEIKEQKGRTFLIAHYSTSTRNNSDIILNSDTTKEINNQVPELNEPSFELKETEAVLSYKSGKRTKYFKITNIKKAQTDFFFQAPK